MFLDKIKKIKTSYIIAALAAGIIMVVLSNSFIDTPEEKTAKINEESSFDYEYASLKLKEIIEGIDGVGDVSVFISYENQGVDKIASVKETMTDDEKASEKNREITKKAGTEESPFITEKVFPSVRGVIIAARGINRGKLEEKIIDAVSSALDVPIHRVKIISKD